jgi:hypothetical protein
MRPIVGADAAVNPRVENPALPAETFQRAGKILVRPLAAWQKARLSS